MKPYYSRTLAAIVLGVLLCGHAYSQASISPRYGIAFSDEGGFTSKPDRWIAKCKAKKERKNGVAIAAQFEQNMIQLRAFSDWLDSIWIEVFSEFARCHNMRGISPAQIHVKIEAHPFPVAGYPPDFLASGVAYHDGHIQIVYWNVRQDIGAQEAIDLFRGELRNWMNWTLTGHPRDMWGVQACP